MEAPESFGFKLHKPEHFDVIRKAPQKVTVMPSWHIFWTGVIYFQKFMGGAKAWVQIWGFWTVLQRKAKILVSFL